MRHWHGHAHGHAYHRRGRMRRWASAKLHRMLFIVLASAIALSLAAAGGVGMLTSESPARWSREWSRAEHFAAGRFAVVWDDPGARTELATSMARDLELRVELLDTAGRVLETHGPPECGGHAYRLHVERAGRRLGDVRLCALRAPGAPFRAPFFALFAAGAVLWLIAGVVSRRIARPLRELTRVAREIGDGKLESRARLGHGPGEIGELARSIDEMAERIQRQLGAQKELLATVSHELRTPLARVRLLVEIARDGTKDRDVLTEIEAEMVEMDALVGELLAGARMDFGALSPRELELRPLLARQVERFAPGAELVCDADLRASADATLLARAVGAMLDNARKHGGQKVVVRVSRSAGGGVAVSVEDDGRGFAAGDEKRVFLPFRRGAGKEDDGRGFGLGLSIVKKIADAHGGSVRAENRAAGGARVVLELPPVPRA